QDLYNRGVLGVVANVGPAALANRASVKANPRALPAGLFAHSGASQVRYLPNGYLTLSWAPGAASASPATILDGGFTLSSSNGPPVLPDAPARDWKARFPQNTAGKMLASVATLLPGAIGRNLFVCLLSGFDTHRDQLSREVSLFTELNDALVAFYQSI